MTTSYLVVLGLVTSVPLGSSDNRSETATTAFVSEQKSRSESRATETIYIIGQGERTTKIAGSAHLVSEEALARFEYDDIQRVLNQVPGVYVRDEDGFGLRPNIGIRGANSDRSAKVVLHEDGVLLGPAPYAAPAAYFVPLTTRMVGLEVFKGPAAIRTGPFTVGGAINYITAGIPRGHSGEVDVAAGNFGYVKGHGRYGWSNDYFGFLIEGVRLTSSGFKELDGGGDTGFEKNELMAKIRVGSDPSKNAYHRLELKLGWADEVSNETYLGLTDEDFRANPYRRYRASQLGRMEWERSQLELSYSFWLGDTFEVRLTGYHHDFERAWFKLNRFGDFTDPRDVLRSDRGPIANAQLAILRGELNSEEIGRAGLLLIGTNDREFVSQGIQLDADIKLQHGQHFEQRIRWGARLHYDEVSRTHTEQTFEVVVQGDQLGSLVRTNDPLTLTLRNIDSALAFSAFVQDDITLFENLVVTPGARIEFIQTRRELPNEDLANTENTQTILIPGLGLYYQLTKSLGLLAGVHRGFSPVAPGQPDAVEPEFSINYELGARYTSERTSFELLGYFNDYSNLLVACTFSAGCLDSEVGKQFNADSIYIYGLEALFHKQWMFGGQVSANLDARYTLTLSEFQNGFSSGNPQFEDVQPGDRLPYVPEHQGNVSGSLGVPIGELIASLSVSYTFVDRMRDRASSGSIGDNGLTEEDFSDRQHIVDLSVQVDMTEQSRVYLRIDNILDEDYLASRRPFGARPGRPFTVQLGYTHRFGAAGR